MERQKTMKALTKTEFVNCSKQMSLFTNYAAAQNYAKKDVSVGY